MPYGLIEMRRKKNTHSYQGLTGLSGMTGIGGIAFSPLDLDPVFYAPIRNQVFEDAAKTDPATESGVDLVYVAVDTAGGNDAVQATQAARPTLIIDGQLWSAKGDGTDDIMTSPYRFSTTDDFTLAVWARNDGQTSGGSVLRLLVLGPDNSGDVANGTFISARRGDASDPGGLQFNAGRSNQFNVLGLGFDDGAWHHIVLVRDGSVVRTYYDGEAKDTGTAQDFESGGDMQIAGHLVFNERHFHGPITDIVICERKLSQAEITKLYNGSGPNKWPIA